MASPAEAVVPPRAAVRGALLFLAPVLMLLALGALLGGGFMLLALALGVAAATPVAPLRLGVGVTTGVGLLVASGGVAGLLAEARPVLAAAIVAGACVVQAPLNQCSAGVGAMVPALVATFASVSFPQRPVALALCLATGFAVAVGTARVLRMQIPDVPVERRTAWRHAVACALAAAAALYATMELGAPHGHWLVLALVLALRPVRGETAVQASERTLGTLAGIALAIVLVLLTPQPVSLSLALVSGFLAVAWGFAGDVRRQALYLTPVVVLVSSAGLAGSGIETAIARLAFTGMGAALAVVLAGLLASTDIRALRKATAEEGIGG